MSKYMRTTPITKIYRKRYYGEETITGETRDVDEDEEFFISTGIAYGIERSDMIRTKFMRRAKRDTCNERVS